jgi:D-aminopeptidase
MHGFVRPGPRSSLTDVPGVQVGHVTLVSGEGALVPGQGPIRTGVTAIIPGDEIYDRKFVAGVHVINGFGKMLGLPQIAELGRLETPILLTSTFSIWNAANGLIEYVLRRHPRMGIDGPTGNPVVGECNDGWLNDIRGRHVRAAHAVQALEEASERAVEEGAVGAGTGMVCYGFKGGIGSASRTGRSDALGRDVVMAALVLANFGRREDLRVDGCPIGRILVPQEDRRNVGGDGRYGGDQRQGDGGSVIVILATDAPFTSRQLTRIARRAAAGLARTGSVHSHGSGDFALAFSTARAYPPYVPDEGDLLDPFFAAAADVTEEAVVRALLAARPMTGRDGHHVDALSREQVERARREWLGRD